MIFNVGSGGNTASKMPAFTYTGEYELIDDGLEEKVQNWRIKLKTSGMLTFQRLSTPIDIFCVGGGGGGYLSGGGGGYTQTAKNQTLTPGQGYEITIGAGGSVASSGATQGGTTAFANLLSAVGGYPGTGGSSARGGDGGSGGGDFGGVARAGNGGSDGSDGGANWIEVQNSSTGQWEWKESPPAGQGQETTTREFGEETGTLYAGGGGGASKPSNGKNNGGYGGDGGGGHGACRGPSSTLAATEGGTNTGGGGGGGNNDGYSSMAGGSGIIVIRNHR